MIENGWGQSGHGTQKLTVSLEWIDGMNWLFACWCKFRKAKIYFSAFRVGLVRIGWGHLAHETLKSAVSEVLCVTEPDFLKKLFLLQKSGKWAKNRVFWIQGKIWSIIFTESVLLWTNVHGQKWPWPFYMFFLLHEIWPFWLNYFIFYAYFVFSN